MDSKRDRKPRHDATDAGIDTTQCSCTCHRLGSGGPPCNNGFDPDPCCKLADKFFISPEGIRIEPGLVVQYISGSGKTWRAVITRVPSANPWHEASLPTVSLLFLDERGKSRPKKRVLHRDCSYLKTKTYQLFTDRVYETWDLHGEPISTNGT